MHTANHLSVASRQSPVKKADPVIAMSIAPTRRIQCLAGMDTANLDGDGMYKVYVVSPTTGRRILLCKEQLRTIGFNLYGRLISGDAGKGAMVALTLEELRAMAKLAGVEATAGAAAKSETRNPKSESSPKPESPKPEANAARKYWASPSMSKAAQRASYQTPAGKPNEEAESWARVEQWTETEAANLDGVPNVAGGYALPAAAEVRAVTLLPDSYATAPATIRFRNGAAATLCVPVPGTLRTLTLSDEQWSQLGEPLAGKIRKAAIGTRTLTLDETELQAVDAACASNQCPVERHIEAFGLPVPTPPPSGGEVVGTLTGTPDGYAFFSGPAAEEVGGFSLMWWDWPKLGDALCGRLQANRLGVIAIDREELATVLDVCREQIARRRQLPGAIKGLQNASFAKRRF